MLRAPPAPPCWEHYTSCGQRDADRVFTFPAPLRFGRMIRVGATQPLLKRPARQHHPVVRTRAEINRTPAARVCKSTHAGASSAGLTRAHAIDLARCKAYGGPTGW